MILQDNMIQDNTHAQAVAKASQRLAASGQFWKCWPMSVYAGCGGQRWPMLAKTAKISQGMQLLIKGVDDEGPLQYGNKR